MQNVWTHPLPQVVLTSVPLPVLFDFAFFRGLDISHPFLSFATLPSGWSGFF
jgi:hypothetical protein